MTLDPEKVRRTQVRVGVPADGVFGPQSLDATMLALGLPLVVPASPAEPVPVPPPSSGAPARPLSWPNFLAAVTNTNAAALTDADFEAAAKRLGHGVQVHHMTASREVEAPRGAFDDQGRPSILYERHVFARNCNPKGKYNATHPSISSNSGYGAGGYGSFSSQWTKLEQAYALDPQAAVEACSWGAFQVLGENSGALGYPSPIDFAITLAASEAAHLDSYCRFVEVNHLVDKLAACVPGNAKSCEPFVAGYNGPNWAQYDYANKFAKAML